MTADQARVVAAWRRWCPDITRSAAAVLRAFRAGHSAGRCSIDPDRACPTGGNCPDCMVHTGGATT